MIDLISEANSIQNFVEENGWDFFFIGGLVTGVWGDPRLTKDIDLTVFTNLDDEPAFIAQFLQRYKPKFSDAEEFALSNRVLPLLSSTGIGIDLTLGGLSEFSEALQRSTYEEFAPGISLRVCSAEDLIIFKTVAGCPRDWGDIDSVVIKQSRLDWSYIFQTLQAYAAYEDLTSRLAMLESIKAENYRDSI